MSYLMIMNFLMAGAAWFLMLVGIETSLIMPSIDRWNRRIIILIHLVLLVCISISILDLFIYGKPEYAQLEIVVIYFEYLFFSVLAPLETLYLLHCCRIDAAHSLAFWIVAALWISFFLKLCMSQFTSSFYYISSENEFYYGEWYFFLMIPLFLIIGINQLILNKNRNRLSHKYYCAFFMYDVVALICVGIQIFFSNVMTSIVGVAIASIVMNFITLSDQIEQHMLQQQEIARQRASIMVLQMRPQYIYNTMTSIYDLCEQNPPKAQQVILDFIIYLRKNFSAIVSEDVIPFCDELEHTRAYLAVEKAQYGDKLLVRFDIPHTLFRMPPLTLQPIVENAITHCMEKMDKPLEIFVCTREKDGGSIIMVEDNGPGFEPSEISGTHNTLSNIRERLDLMCQGDIKISSREGGGTCVQLIIPERLP